MNTLRIFFIGGAISFRALFNWLNPWIYIPSMLIAPIFQILLFAYLGRSAQVGSDKFYVIGNAVQYSAIPCLFAMANTIAGERRTQTLGIVLSTPAPRIALFLGRSLPVVINGWVVSMFSLFVGGRVLGIDLPVSALPAIAIAAAVGSASCTGLGLINAATGLRVRETAVLSNVIFGVLLIFSGANVAVTALPDWMAAVSQWLPLTHAIAAARLLADGAPLASTGALLGREGLLAIGYAMVGLAALRIIEADSRRRATLETQ